MLTDARKSFWTRIACCAVAVFISNSALATKAEGPYSITAKFSDGHAEISVRTSVAAKNLELQLYGSDGLEVKDAAPMGTLHIKSFHRAALAPGEIWMEQADIIPGEGMTYLNVSVSAKEEGSVTRAFSFGTLSEKQKAERQRGTTRDPEGNYIRLMGD